MPERDELERLIDSELASYAEPRAGLEQRVLARLEADGAWGSRIFLGWHRWALAGAIAMAIALIIGLPRFTHRVTVNTAGESITNQQRIASAKDAAPDVHVRTRHLPRIAKSMRSARQIASGSAMRSENPQRPKLDIFPAPQPLSPQEQFLAELATHLPKAERERLLSGYNSQNAPLEISSIKISPITVPMLGKN